MIITTPTARITKAIPEMNNTCNVIPLSTSRPVGGVNVTNSVALWSLSANDSLNCSTSGFALPGIVASSLLPEIFSYFTISAMLSYDKLSASSVAETVFVTVKSIADL